MDKKILLARKNIVGEYHKELNYLYLRWIGFQRETAIYESGEKILEIFKELDCSKILNDNREVKGPWSNASEWTLNYWFPEMVGAGLKKFAWVFPEDPFAEISATKAMPNNELIHKFKTYEEAETWLMEQ